MDHGSMSTGDPSWRTQTNSYITNTTQNDSEKEEVETAANYIIMICTPIIVLLGTVGNILCIIIMRQRHFRSISTGVYLLCLALADTMFLYVNSMSMNFTRLLWDFDFRTVHEVTCKIYIYLLMVSKCLSAWFIVAVTAERLLVITFPLKAHVLATRRRAWLVVFGFILITGSLYLLPVVTYGHQPQKGWIGCDMDDKYIRQKLDIALKFMDLILHCVLPSCVLFFSNAILTYRLVQSGRLRAILTQNQTASVKQSKTTSRLTIMLLLISFVFLLLNLPMSLYLFSLTINPAIAKYKHHDLIYRILYTLQITNSATNFPLYCLSGPLFRNETLRLFYSQACCRKILPKNTHAYELVSSSGGRRPSSTFVTTTRRSGSLGFRSSGGSLRVPSGNARLSVLSSKSNQQLTPIVETP